MTFICLQAGHEGRAKGVTGAPGEIELNVRIRNRLSELLIERDFQIKLVAADPTDDEIKDNFDLFLALHGDADTRIDGGCIASGDRNVDGSWEKSLRISGDIGSEYFKESGIANVPGKVTVAMTYYYMWMRLTMHTPCVILEMGEVQDAHDKVILADTDRVAIAITKGICKAFDVPYELGSETPKQPEDPADPCKSLKDEIDRLKSTMSSNKTDFETVLALKGKECEEKLKAYKQRLTDELTKVINNTKLEE